MSPRTSIDAARKDSARSRERARRRRSERETRPRRTGWRRWPVIAGALLAGAAVAVLVANSDRVQDALLEVTLPLKHEDIIRQQSPDKGVPPDLIAAVIFRESHFRDQTSDAGARGLMQITPETAEIIENLSGGTTFTQEALTDPDLNSRDGAVYLRYLLDRFDGNVVAALAAYNAGETNVSAWGGSSLQLDDIRFEETRQYVEDVLEKRD